MCTIPDYRKVSNAKIIPRKSKKGLFNPDISFLGLPFYDILTFECKFDRMQHCNKSGTPGIITGFHTLVIISINHQLP